MAQCVKMRYKNIPALPCLAWLSFMEDHYHPVEEDKPAPDYFFFLLFSCFCQQYINLTYSLKVITFSSSFAFTVKHWMQSQKC